MKALVLKEYGKFSIEDVPTPEPVGLNGYEWRIRAAIDGIGTLNKRAFKQEILC
jgi:hypothetical protein